MGAELEALRKHFPDPHWRLNHLYHVIDEKGEDSAFHLRPAQEKFLRNMWYFNLILKARQLGFTTLIDLIGLDMALFKPNCTAKIIAETKDKAADIFDAKILYPYDRLPKEVKQWCPIIARSKDGSVEFGNGSSIKVSVSARSGTCNFLHISEYGPVCARQPEKATEIKRGSLPAVHAGSFCFIESTAMGNSGHFYEMTMAALAAKLSGRKLDMQEYRLHFFPWWENPEYATRSEEIVVPQRLQDYFQKLDMMYGIKLDNRQRAWYTVQEKTLHEDMWSEFPSFPEEAFQVAKEGAYYARQFQDIYRDHRICGVPYDRHLPVYTAWDLGMSDETSIWFFQFYGKEIRVIDYYQANGEALGHYANVLLEKEYRYGGHFAPHDIAVRELSSGVSRLESARKLGINFERIPTNLDLAGGIENVREMLGYCWFDEAKTEIGRKCLEAYRREFDEKNNCYRSHPLHDWSSHGADSFRTMAMAWKMGRVRDSSTEMMSGGNTSIRITGGLRRI